MGNILLPCTSLLVQIDKAPCLLSGNIYIDFLQLETFSNQTVFFSKAKKLSAIYRKVLKKQIRREICSSAANQSSASKEMGKKKSQIIVSTEYS